MVQELELHHINVIGGDATLILVSENGKTLFRGLIDSGAESKGSSTLWDYLERIGENGKFRPGKNGSKDACNLDLLICTHFHADHIKGFNMGSRFIPRYFLLTSKHQGQVALSPTYPDFGSVVNPSLLTNSVISQFHSFEAEGIGERIALPFTNMDADAPASIELSQLVPALQATNLRMNIVASNGIVAGLAAKRAGSTATARIDTFKLAENDPRGLLVDPEDVAAARATYIRSTNPNDYSISTFIEFGNFTFLTTGDLSGAASRNKDGAYKNVEQYLINSLETAGWIKATTTGPGIDAVKIAHHGSNNSTYVASDTDSFLQKVRPAAMVVPSNQKKGVPGNTFLGRASDYLIAKKTAAPDGASIAAGMLMANETEFVEVENATTYENLNRVRLGSTVAVGVTPDDWKKSIPFNLPTIENERGLNALSNIPNAAVIVCANDNGSKVEASAADFGEAIYRYENFTLLTNTMQLDTATTQAGSSARKFKLPSIAYNTLVNLTILDLDYFKAMAVYFYQVAAAKIYRGGTAAHGYSYIKKYAPLTFQFFTWNEGEDTINQTYLNAYRDGAAPALMLAFYKIYTQSTVPTPEGDVYRYTFDKAKQDALSYAELQTLAYAIQIYMYERSFTERALARRLGLNKVIRYSEASVSSPKAIRKGSKKQRVK